MNKILFIIVFLFGCSQAETPNLNYYGKAVESFGLHLYLDNVVEANTINDNNKIINHYDKGFKGNFIQSETLDNQDAKPCNVKIRFPYVIKYKEKFYAFGWKYPEEHNIYMWESIDGVNWILIKQILFKSDNPNSIWYNIWNIGVTIDNNGTCHLLAEVAPKCDNQEKVGLAYTTSKFEDMNFFQNEEIVIDGGGNPYVYYLNGNLTVVHGIIHKEYKNFTKDFWWVTMSTYENNKWTTRSDEFSFGERGIHVCDPHLVDIKETTAIVFSWNQKDTYCFFIKEDYESNTNK